MKKRLLFCACIILLTMLTVTIGTSTQLPIEGVIKNIEIKQISQQGCEGHIKTFYHIIFINGYIVTLTEAQWADQGPLQIGSKIKVDQLEEQNGCTKTQITLLEPAK